MAFPLQSTCVPGVASFTQNDSAPIATPPQLAILDWFFPGFSMVASVIHKYTRVDLNLYIPLVLLAGMLVVCWNYASSYVWEQVQSYFMSTVDIRTDDEIYNILMAWVAAQRFSKGARRFIVNTSLASRSWYVWRYDDEDEEDGEGSGSYGDKKKHKALSYTPSFGSHYFWYRGNLLLFRRISNREQNSNMLVSEREEISLSCFGRNPWILKELLLEARDMYNKKDERNTQIYRGTSKPPFSEPGWQRCMSRASRPFSTVILNEKTKQELIDDVTDYLNPVTQRWYANRGIPYRRGYLLHGPPGTGKSSLSLALAGFFKMRIYIVSLNSVNANEETLGNLFAALPRRCVVLLEDIDTAGLTHTREKTEDKTDNDNKSKSSNEDEKNHRLSLSGLLNILDGVASQEGRVLIMTTNHVEKLDKALIRPGRVDMIVRFGLADDYMAASIFRNIFSYLEGDDEPATGRNVALSVEELKTTQEKAAKDRAAHDAEIDRLAKVFGAKIPAHEFSPAELQGHLMKHKHQPQKAIDTIEEFVEHTRRDRKEKELKEAEEKREAERLEAEAAKKKAEEDKDKEKGEASSDATEKETEAETELKKRVEEEIRKTFEEEIRKKVEAEIKKAKKEKEEKSSSSPVDGESKIASETSEMAASSDARSTTPIEKPIQDSGYSTPSTSEK